MIQGNKKIYFNRSQYIIETEFHTDTRKIIADILEMLYYDEIVEYGINLDFSNIVYISNKARYAEMIEIPKEFFEEFQNLQNIEFPVKVFAVPPAYLLKQNALFNFNVIIMGFINNIHPKYYDIVSRYSTSKIVLFGDPLIDAPEYNNYHMRLLTNAAYQQKLEPDLFRNSDKKRINIALNKFRKESFDLGSISSNSCVNLNYDSQLNTQILDDYINESQDNWVIIPKHTIAKINSLMWLSKKSARLDINMQDIFYTKYPFVLESYDGESITIPALSKVYILLDNHDVQRSNHNGHICKSYSVMFEYKNKDGKIVKIQNLPPVYIDYYSFLMGFDPELHGENHDEYIEMITFMDQIKEVGVIDDNILEIVPFRILTPEICKYVPIPNLLVYFEVEDRNINYLYDYWYKQLATTLNTINIRYMEVFRNDDIMY